MPDAALVLVVEDDPETRRYYADALSRGGFETHQAHNGLQALQKAIDLRPALILNRRGEIRHEAHEHQPPAGPAAEYNGYLAALDSPYFSMWAGYRARLDDLRARGASEQEELALQREAFSRPTHIGAAIYHAARCARAFVNYRVKRVAATGAAR